MQNIMLSKVSAVKWNMRYRYKKKYAEQKG